jgi:23S rRNA pseudouridine1911/1915/1917 synthase
LKRAVLEYGKPAITHYRVIERFPAHSHIRVMLETGRTHQIRAHMFHISYPIVGDKIYGGRLRIPPKADPLLLEKLRNFPRQALHAKELDLVHPVTKEWMHWEQKLPADMQELLEVLQLQNKPR